MKRSGVHGCPRRAFAIWRQQLDDLQPLNRWTVRQFERLWYESGAQVLMCERIPAQANLDLVTRYPQFFQGRGLTTEDLTTQGLRVHLRKPVEST